MDEMAEFPEHRFQPTHSMLQNVFLYIYWVIWYIFLRDIGISPSEAINRKFDEHTSYIENEAKAQTAS